MNLFCPWEPAQYLFFSSNIPNLLYYSHISAIIIALIIGLLVYRTNRKFLISKVFLLMLSLFSVWLLIDIILWATNNPSEVMFFWPLQILTEVMVFVSALYFVKVYMGEVILSKKIILILSLLLFPFLFIIATKYGIIGINLEDCYALESNLIVYFSYFIEIFISIWIVKLFITYRKNINKKKKEVLFFVIGLTLFLLAFSSGNIIGSFTDDWILAQYGLIGMPIFAGILTYSIVSFHSFSIKLLSSEALVWGLAVLIGSQFFFIQTTTNFILNGITFVGIVIFGQILVRSVKKEVEQREKLQILTAELSEANEKLKGLDKLKTEFLSLASHQLRSPLTAIKGYTSMLLEGDYGEVNPKVKETIERVFQSSNNLTIVVEDLLNVAKIEQGGMKYEMSSFNLSDVARSVAKDLSITAEKKNIKLSFEEDGVEDCVTIGDENKIRQVVLNFIDNSIKYTKEGWIKVKVEKKGEKVLFSVKDTGMGMTEEIKETLFQKFARGEGSRVNSGGSGLGLYLAKEIVEAHKGRVWVESEGTGKGSTFFMELDAVIN